nr:hypothetical protein [Tanacetum cinerariifolium]
IAQPGMNMGQDRQMQMVGGNGGNQFRQSAGQNAGNPAGYNDVIGNQVIQTDVQNLRVQNVKDIKEKDKIRDKTRQNQEQTGSVEKSKVKPDKVKAQSKPKRNPHTLLTYSPNHTLLTYCHLGNLEKPHWAGKQDKDSMVKIDLIEGQGK